MSAALDRLEGSDESQDLHKEIAAKLTELSALRSQHAELKSMHSVLAMKYKEKKGKPQDCANPRSYSLLTPLYATTFSEYRNIQ